VGDFYVDSCDHLFPAFNTSTAFSPTDVLVLSRWGEDINDDSGLDFLAGDCLVGSARR